MNPENDPEFNFLIQANRQAIDRLRSWTEDLTAVVEHERRLVKDIQPILDGQRSRNEGQKESPEAARGASLPGSSTEQNS